MMIGILFAGLLIFCGSLAVAHRYGAKAATCSVLLAWGIIVAGIAVT